MSFLVEITPAHSESDLAVIRRLFRAYASSLQVDLCFQGFEEELATLPGRYAAPNGALWLAKIDGQAVGCIGLRAFSKKEGELKRLYVLPEQRGRGVARALVVKALEGARAAGYTTVVLDTLATMTAAIQLYTSVGFRPAEPYYPNPLPGVLYFRCVLEG
ncbi:MAG TPA: GNAT family N-acetyltransferase [Opitutaceae bacterium]|nr:GNAT family N-acetyltransferase [Opitutaceae bacterium]